MPLKKLSFVVLSLTCLAVMTARAQIPTWEERQRDSGWNREYWENWRSGYLVLPEVANPQADEPDLMACFRKDFELPAPVRRAAVSLYVPGRDRGPYWFTVNDEEVEGPRWGKHQLGGLRNLDITEQLRAGHNVLTFRAPTRRPAGQPRSSENWVVVEGIIFCEDGSTHRILTDGWRGGWDLAEGWDAAAAPAATIAGLEAIAAPAPLVWSINPYTCLPPYYGPIKARPVSAARPDLEQPIFDEEEPVVLDVTLLNMRAAADTVELSVEIMDEMTRAELGTHTVDCVPAGALDLSGRLELGRLERGAYRLRFILEEDGAEIERRDVEVAVVGELSQHLVEGTHYEDGLDLEQVWDIDCTAEPEDGLFIAAHTVWDRTPAEGVRTRVVEGPAGRYRELEARSAMLYFAYQYRVKNLYRPHLAVVEWPDDALRNFIIHVTEESSGAGNIFGHQRSDTSVNMSNDLQPERSGRMQKLHLLFWPNSVRGSVHVTNVGGGDKGAAAARITIYEITNDLPALRVADAGDRLIGPHTERGPQTMSAAYYAGPLGNAFTFRMAANDHPEFYRNWYTVGENFIKRMRFEGSNLYLMGHLMYNGTLYPSRMSDWGYRQDNYFGGDAVRDYVTLLLRMFERNGIYMISNIEHRDVPAFTPGRRERGVNYSPSHDEIVAGAEHPLLIRRDGHIGRAPNYFHPFIQDGLIAMVGELADLYGAAPAWKGINFLLASSHGGFGPIDLLGRDVQSLDELPEYGYEDYSVALFEEQTGIKVPGAAGDPERYRQRYEWLMANARAEWIQWRCDQYTDLWRRMRDRLRADNPDLELYLLMGEPLPVAWRPTQDLMDGYYDDTDYMLRMLRKFGFDLPALQAEEGIRVIKSYTVAGSGAAGAARGHEGWRELNLNRGFQSLFANDGRGGAYMATSIPHFGGYGYPWSRDPAERVWLWDRVTTRQGWTWSTHAVDSFVNVMARSNPTLLPHTWMDVNESMGRIHEKRLFARAYRSLPNGQYERLTGNGLDRNLWVSRTVRDGVEYVYAANLYWCAIETTLNFAPGARVHDLIADRPVELRAGDWTFTLPPYQIRTFRLTGGALQAARAAVPAGDLEYVTEKVEDALQRAAETLAVARRRADELSGLDGWHALADLEGRVARLHERREAGDLLGAYSYTRGSLPIARELIDKLGD